MFQNHSGSIIQAILITTDTLHEKSSPHFQSRVEKDSSSVLPAKQINSNILLPYSILPVPLKYLEVPFYLGCIFRWGQETLLTWKQKGEANVPSQEPNQNINRINSPMWLPRHFSTFHRWLVVSSDMWRKQNSNAK